MGHKLLLSWAAAAKANLTTVRISIAAEPPLLAPLLVIHILHKVYKKRKCSCRQSRCCERCMHTLVDAAGGMGHPASMATVIRQLQQKLVLLMTLHSFMTLYGASYCTR